MNEPGYLKCPCHCCRGAIEFPVEGVGRTISCPHCGQETTLFAASVGTETEGAPEPAPSIAEPALGLTDETLSPEGETVAADSAAPPPSAGFRWLGIVVVILLASGGAVALFREKLFRPVDGSGSRTARSTPATNTPDGVHESRTNLPVAAAAGAGEPKSIEDLKVGPIQLEKAKGSSLVYAVGILRNESAHQRFGVKLELALTDVQGRPAGTAKDYRSVLEAGQEWRFRALVLDPKAASARVAAVREDE